MSDLSSSSLSNSVRMPEDPHTYNDDLLVLPESRTKAKAEFPGVYHVLDHEELRAAFDKQDLAANAAKRRSQAWGFWALLCALAALMAGAAAPVWGRSQGVWPGTIAVLSAVLAIVSAGIAWLGLLRGTNKGEWLHRRLFTESLRQFHFQTFIWRLEDIAASLASPDGKEQYRTRRSAWLASFQARFGPGQIGVRLSQVLDPNLVPQLWTHNNADRREPVIPAGLSLVELFRAYKALRLEEQFGYAAHVLRQANAPSDKPVAPHRRLQFPFAGVPLVVQHAILRNTWVVAFVALLALELIAVANHFSHAESPFGTWLHVVALWAALIAIAAKTLSEGLAHSRDLERYGRTHDAQVLDADTGKQKLCLAGHSDIVEAAGYNLSGWKKGWRIVTGSRDRTARVWNDETGHLEATLLGHTQAVTAVAFSPTSLRIVTGGADGVVKMWDPDAIPRKASHIFGSTGAFGPHAEGISPDGTRVLIGGGLLSSPCICDALTGKKLLELNEALPSLSRHSFSGDSASIAVSNDDHSIGIISARSGTPSCRLRGHTGRVLWVQMSPDGSRLISGAEDNSIRLWNTYAGNELVSLRDQSDWTSRSVFSSDGKRAFVGTTDGRVVVLDALTGLELAVIVGCGSQVSPIWVSPEGTEAIAVNAEGQIAVIDTLHFRIRNSWQIKNHSHGPMVVSPDGTRLATTIDRMIEILDARTGVTLATCIGHGDSINCLAFAPDGSRLASGSEDRTIRMWDVEFGQDALVLRGHSGGVSKLVFGRDGTWLVSESNTLGNSDDQAIVWESPATKEMQEGMTN